MADVVLSTRDAFRERLLRRVRELAKDLPAEKMVRSSSSWSCEVRVSTVREDLDLDRPREKKEEEELAHSSRDLEVDRTRPKKVLSMCRSILDLEDLLLPRFCSLVGAAEVALVLPLGTSSSLEVMEAVASLVVCLLLLRFIVVRLRLHSSNSLER